jgi:hypothetical protein
LEKQWSVHDRDQSETAQMKILLLAGMIACSPCLAGSAPPAPIIHSCLKTASVRDAVYTDISPTDFTIEENDSHKRTATTLVHRGQTLGIWESSESEDFGLVFKTAKIPLAKIIKVGPDAPARFTPYTAQWGAARYGTHRYLCITFNFPGLGESGSFQNKRGLYLIDARKPPKFYYTVGDIRAVKH